MNANHMHPHPFEGEEGRYVSYCRAAGYESIYQQWATDRSNAFFDAWTVRKLKEWREATGYSGGMDEKHNAAFDAWLEVQQ